jgi:hypothetical protein
LLEISLVTRVCSHEEDVGDDHIHTSFTHSYIHSCVDM